jgi:hypothetical protein
MSSASNVYDLVSSADSAGLEEFTTLFAYEGFNPEMVHKHFATVKEERGISDIEFIGDMRALITLGALKGNYTIRNSGKISDAGRDRADSLYSKYKLKVGSLGGDKKAVILPRILSAFPELTTKVIMHVEPRDFGLRTMKYPKFMKNPVFPAMIPKTLSSRVVSTFLYLYTVYSADQSLVISSEKDFDAAFTVQRQFCTIAFNSSVPPESVRIKVFKTVKEDLLQAISDYKELTVGSPPSDRADAEGARIAIDRLKRE